MIRVGDADARILGHRELNAGDRASAARFVLERAVPDHVGGVQEMGLPAELGCGDTGHVHEQQIFRWTVLGVREGTGRLDTDQGGVAFVLGADLRQLRSSCRCQGGAHRGQQEDTQQLL